MNIHATCVARNGQGILLRGPSGAGKSDLALRLIDRGFVLISDDRVDLVPQGASLFAQAPESLIGRLEVRGLGIINMPYEPRAGVILVADLQPARDIARLPEAVKTELCGVQVPSIAIAPFELSAPIKLELALNQISDPANDAAGA